jgi:hypothetical protein
MTTTAEDSILVQIINGPPGSKTIGWVCEVMENGPDSLQSFLKFVGHNGTLRLRTIDETIHPEGYFYVYKRNVKVMNQYDF